MRRLSILLAGLLCSGCFALDEIDAGNKEMDRYDKKHKAADQAAAAGASGEKQLSSAEKARQWWDKARTFEPRTDDEKSDIVSCQIAGATRFMSQADCANSGGRFAGGG
jgi:hypothetical protein